MENEENYTESKDGLLEDFESELVADDKARKKRRLLIFVGVIAGAAIWFFLSSKGNDLPPDKKVVQQAKPSEKKEEAENIEQLIAKLHEQNKIDEDFKAPGALMDNKPMEPSALKKEAEPDKAPEPEAVAKIEPEEALKVEETTIEEIDLTEAAPLPLSPVAVLASPVAKERYSVQVIATMDALTALEERDKLIKRRFEAWISMGKSKQNVYRVESGEFKSIQEASSLSAVMAQAGFVTRTAYIKGGSRVTLVAGTFEDERNAKRLNKRIASSGFPSRISNKPDIHTLYLVRVGRYKSMREAINVKEKVRRAGFPILGITQ